MSDEKKADIRNEQAVKENVEHASSEILDIIGANGKVTNSGALPTPCSDYAPEENVHRMRHPWSIYDVRDEKLREAMGSLRKALPSKGWEIVKDGPDSSQAQLPQIVADSPDGHMSTDIRLWIEAPGSSSMIEVTVVSDCFRSGPSATAKED
ncbi:hypothetical protein [Streptomyces sp. WG7]|uniref:hypothetical protein n=1 Tax=Streptomyces sp. WG7 TaxID=3417650 RepID=UPI003CE82102